MNPFPGPCDFLHRSFLICRWEYSPIQPSCIKCRLTTDTRPSCMHTFQFGYVHTPLVSSSPLYLHSSGAATQLSCEGQPECRERETTTTKTTTTTTTMTTKEQKNFSTPSTESWLHEWWCYRHRTGSRYSRWWCWCRWRHASRIHTNGKAALRTRALARAAHVPRLCNFMYRLMAPKFSFNRIKQRVCSIGNMGERRMKRIKKSTVLVWAARGKRSPDFVFTSQATFELKVRAALRWKNETWRICFFLFLPYQRMEIR